MRLTSAVFVCTIKLTVVLMATLPNSSYADDDHHHDDDDDDMFGPSGCCAPHNPTAQAVVFQPRTPPPTSPLSSPRSPRSPQSPQSSPYSLATVLLTSTPAPAPVPTPVPLLSTSVHHVRQPPALPPLPPLPPLSPRSQSSTLSNVSRHDNPYGNPNAGRRQNDDTRVPHPQYRREGTSRPDYHVLRPDYHVSRPDYHDIRPDYHVPRPEYPRGGPRQSMSAFVPHERAAVEWLTVIFMRLRKRGDRQWYEYLVERSPARDAYGFPRKRYVADTGNAKEEAALSAASRAACRGLILAPSSTKDLEACLQYETPSALGSGLDDTALPTRGPTRRLRLYFLHLELTQKPRPERVLGSPPALYWVTSSELSGHVDVGPPSAFGLRIEPQAVSAFESLPPSLRFASTTPPLVLYHGTTASSTASIAELGLVASITPGMLGNGVYLARWDKAATFAARDAGNVARTDDGVVVRCVFFPGTTRTMTRDMICTCGCGAPFVDHQTSHGKAHQTTYVPDHSLPATRRAEWCTREPTAVICDGVFTL